MRGTRTRPARRPCRFGTTSSRAAATGSWSRISMWTAAARWRSQKPECRLRTARWAMKTSSQRSNIAKLGEQIQELRAKRAEMTTDTKEWDFNMKEVEECSVLLTGRIEELAKATTDRK